MASKILLILCIYSIQLIINAAKLRSGSLRIIYTKVECSPTLDPTIVELFECGLTPQIAPGLSPALTMHLRLARDIKNNVIAPFNLSFERNGKRDTFISVDVDVCMALGALYENTLFKLIYDIRRYSNLPLQCPLKKDFDYYTNNFTFDSNFLPPYAPEVLWDSVTDVLVKGKKVFHFKAYGKTIREKKKHGG